MRDFVFACPSCGYPYAQTIESDVDICSGHQFTCNQCGAEVLFEAMTVTQYMTYHGLLRQAHEAAKGGGKAL